MYAGVISEREGALSLLGGEHHRFFAQDMLARCNRCLDPRQVRLVG